MKRFGQIIGLRAEYFERYKSYHYSDWDKVLEALKACNFKDYSIFRKGVSLYAYFEYSGIDFNADILRMASNPYTMEWWKIMRPMQQPVVSQRKEEWSVEMEEVFHLG